MKAQPRQPHQFSAGQVPQACDQPMGMPAALVLLFAVASGMSVANVYYAQPLLDALAEEFHISYAAVGGVVTATQLGCALALLLLVPLGDRLDRRQLMAWQLAGLVMALLVVGAAQTTAMLYQVNSVVRHLLGQFARWANNQGTRSSR